VKGVRELDFLPDKEFNEVFNRVTRTVDLKDAESPSAVNSRLNGQIMKYHQKAGRNPLSRMRAEAKSEPLRKLIRSGFGRRVIDEAFAKPQGKVALTLKYGRERAERILKKQQKRRIT